MKKEDKIVMDQYATGEIKAVEPSEELPKYKFSKWEEYYTNAVDLIEKKFSHRNRQWCHDQLNRALDNTEFHHLADVVSPSKYDDAKCQMIDEILAGEFGINTQNPYLDWAEDSIGDALFELREHIVERFLNCDDGRELLRNQELKTKYNLLEDAMEILNEKESK